jgi:aflatoxin B1 aldehyde reductase
MGRVFAAHPELLERPMSIATKANPWPGGNMTSSAGQGGAAQALRSTTKVFCH